MSKDASMPLGIVIERHKSANRWQDWRFQPVAVIPGAPDVAGWSEMLRGEGWVRYHAATLTVWLYRTQTPAYLHNLSMEQPVVYIVLRRDPDQPEEFAFQPLLVTVSPYEAEEYLISGDEIVEPVAMPDVVMGWIQDFIDSNHVDQPFVKRQRDKHKEKRPDSPLPLDAYGKPIRQGGNHG